MDTAFFKNAVSEHKKTAIGGVGGVSVASLLFVAWPYVTDLKSSNTAQWQQISVLKAQVAALEKDVAVLQTAVQIKHQQKETK